MVKVAGDLRATTSRPGDITFHPLCIIVLHIDSGGLLDIAAFEQPLPVTAESDGPIARAGLGPQLEEAR